MKTKGCKILKLKSNGCTEHIRIHPIKSGSWFLVPINMTEKEKNSQYLCTSIIIFDIRQIWDVYYSKFEDGAVWVVERRGLYLRMRDKDFIYFFGEYKIQ